MAGAKPDRLRAWENIKMTDFLLCDAGTIFFTTWICMVTGIGIAVFGRDLVPVIAQPQRSRNRVPHACPRRLRSAEKF